MCHAVWWTFSYRHRLNMLIFKLLNISLHFVLARFNWESIQYCRLLNNRNILCCNVFGQGKRFIEYVSALPIRIWEKKTRHNPNFTHFDIRVHKRTRSAKTTRGIYFDFSYASAKNQHKNKWSRKKTKTHKTSHDMGCYTHFVYMIFITWNGLIT